MADEDDLVSQVRIEGTDTATAQLDTLADKGGAAFDKLNKSANTAAKGVQAAGQTIEKAGQQAQAGTQAFAAGSSRLQAFGKEIGNVKDLVDGLGQKLPQLAQALGRFSQRVATAGAAAAAAGVALARVAQNTAKAYDGQSTAADDFANSQKDANNRMLEGQVAAINYDAAQRKLFQDAIQGKITWVQYSAALQQLKKDFDEQQRVAAEIKNAQDDVAEANKRLDKQLADKKATDALIETFGGPLLSSLVNFGHTVEAISALFKGNFGPAAAGLIDLINGVVTKNLGSITQFFTQAAAKIQALITTNGPQIEQFLTNIGKAAASVFDGIIAAAPAIIDFVNNQLVPAIQKVVGFLDGIANAINSVFGTRLTAGSIILIGIFAQVTGSIRLLTSLIRIFGSVFKDVFKIAGGAVTAFAGLFGGPAAANIAKLGTVVAATTNPISLFFNVIKSGIPVLITLVEVVGGALGISFGAAVVVVLALGAALAYIIATTDWKGFLADAQAALDGIIAFFKATYAIVQGTIAFWVAQFQAFPGSLAAIGGAIGAFFLALWNGVKQYAADAWAGIVSIWEAAVDFFTGIGQGIQNAFNTVWDYIKAGWQAALNTVTGYVTSWVASIKAYLQPIIDLINAIAGAVSNAAGAATGGAVEAATGGAISGPGSGTSDSIPAWLSNGEFVTKAAAVKKVGVGFMHALNNGAINVRGFADGGLATPSVSSPSVGYALKGNNDNSGGGLTPLNLSLFGETFAGLLMPENVAGRLTRYAVAKQTKSAGRKPAWVGRSRN